MLVLAVRLVLVKCMANLRLQTIETKLKPVDMDIAQFLALSDYFIIMFLNVAAHHRKDVRIHISYLSSKLMSRVYVLCQNYRLIQNAFHVNSSIVFDEL